MMSVPKATRLLMYGYDAGLLETRRSILQMAGFSVCAIAGSGSFKKAAESASEPYDLLVICRTVPAEEQIAIASFAAQRHMQLFQIEGFIAPEDLIKEVSRMAERLVTS